MWLIFKEIDTNYEMIQILKLSDKDFKSATTNKHTLLLGDRKARKVVKGLRGWI